MSSQLSGVVLLAGVGLNCFSLSGQMSDPYYNGSSPNSVPRNQTRDPNFLKTPAKKSRRMNEVSRKTSFHNPHEMNQDLSKTPSQVPFGMNEVSWMTLTQKPSGTNAELQVLSPQSVNNEQKPRSESDRKGILKQPSFPSFHRKKSITFSELNKIGVIEKTTTATERSFYGNGLTYEDARGRFNEVATHLAKALGEFKPPHNCGRAYRRMVVFVMYLSLACCVDDPISREAAATRLCLALTENFISQAVNKVEASKFALYLKEQLESLAAAEQKSPPSAKQESPLSTTQVTNESEAKTPQKELPTFIYCCCVGKENQPKPTKSGAPSLLAEHEHVFKVLQKHLRDFAKEKEYTSAFEAAEKALVSYIENELQLTPVSLEAAVRYLTDNAANVLQGVGMQDEAGRSLVECIDTVFMSFGCGPMQSLKEVVQQKVREKAEQAKAEQEKRKKAEQAEAEQEKAKREIENRSIEQIQQRTTLTRSMKENRSIQQPQQTTTLTQLIEERRIVQSINGKGNGNTAVKMGSMGLPLFPTDF